MPAENSTPAHGLARSGTLAPWTQVAPPVEMRARLMLELTQVWRAPAMPELTRARWRRPGASLTAVPARVLSAELNLDCRQTAPRCRHRTPAYPSSSRAALGSNLVAIGPFRMP